MLLRSLWLAGVDWDQSIAYYMMLKDNCGRKWQLQRIENKVCMALPFFCGHPSISLKYALHHLSLWDIFLYLASLSCIISLLGYATSQLWNLNHIISLLSDAVSHQVSEIWTTSPSSNIWSWCCIISPLRACSCNVKVLAAFSSHLQGFVSIFLHPQSLDRISLHLQIGRASCRERVSSKV